MKFCQSNLQSLNKNIPNILKYVEKLHFDLTFNLSIEILKILIIYLYMCSYKIDPISSGIHDRLSKFTHNVLYIVRKHQKNVFQCASGRVRERGR